VCAHSQQFSALPELTCAVDQATVDQHIGNAGLLMNALRRRAVVSVDRADIQNEIRLECEQTLQRQRAATTGQPSQQRQLAGRRREHVQCAGGQRPGPAQQLVGRKGMDEHRGRSASGKYALDAVWRRQRAKNVQASLRIALHFVRCCVGGEPGQAGREGKKISSFHVRFRFADSGRLNHSSPDSAHLGDC
jgi:hypothetical protein